MLPSWPAQRRRHGQGDAAARQMARHGASARLLRSGPDAAGEFDPAGSVIGIVTLLRCRICAGVAAVEQPAAPQLGKDVAGVTAGVAMRDDAAVAVAQRQRRATAGAGAVHQADAAPPWAGPARRTERMSNLGRGHDASGSLVERRAGSASR